jgi:hypothetical protein
MKTPLLPENGTFFKANLHCHSTLSDGSLGIDALKRAYVERGYSIIAFTDHDRYFPHNDLNDGSFLAINGYEVDISEPRTKTNNHIKCYHLNCYDTRPCRTGPVEIPPYPAYSDIAGINEFISRVKDDGFIVCYNHPHWSLQTLDDYRELEGLFALEVYNHSSYVNGTPETQTHVFDEFLRMNKRVFCVASDDNHDRAPLGTPENDSFGGFVMIKALELTTEAVMDALQSGGFYASRGPLIEELFIDGNQVHIKTSPARSISVCIAGRDAQRRIVGDDDTLTEAVFTLDPNDDVYFRLEVTDHRGYKAYTNAYFFDVLGA